ncbi:MAG: DNRLRE domain-containing protein [Planctomycetes bacterium]|nr:DNRLRE domain-containing protein [Planctomycetota bacterium]
MFAGANLSALARRALLHFDVAAALPAGATIRTARLELSVVMSRAGSSPLPVGLHRVTSDWGEGTSVGTRGEGGGASSTPGDATWLHTFYPSSFWTSPGGDFVAAASAQASAPRSGTVALGSTAGTVADVQGWLDRPATNFGWLVLGDENAPGDARAFGSREQPTATLRPRLVVTYDPPGAAASVTSFGAGCAGPSSVVASLSANGLPRLGNAAFGLSAVLDPASLAPTATLSLLRFPGPIVLSGCEIWIDPAAFVDGLPLGAVGQLPLPVPNVPALAGLLLEVQAVSLDVGGNRALTSNLLELALGY